MQHLRDLEDQSVYILREAYKHFDDLAMLWSMGKDSTVLLWLARKAFFGHVPFPLVHIDTGYEMPELIDDEIQPPLAGDSTRDRDGVFIADVRNR